VFGKHENISREGFEMKLFIYGLVIGIIFKIYLAYISVNGGFFDQIEWNKVYEPQGLDGPTGPPGLCYQNPKCQKDPSLLDQIK
jgi:hypothetical protein